MYDVTSYSGVMQNEKHTAPATVAPEQSRADGRVTIAIDKEIHETTTQIQKLLKPEFPNLRCAVRTALEDWNAKHRRRALAAATAALKCPRVSRKHNNTETQPAATA
jgi:hypothetical protein